MSGGMAWTIHVRCDSLELWRDLVLHGMGEVDFHVLPKRTYEYNQLIRVGCAQTGAVGDPMVVMRLFASFLRS